MAITVIKTPAKVTVGTTEVEYAFDPSLVPMDKEVTVLIQFDPDNTNVIYAAAEPIDTTAHADWKKGMSCELEVKNFSKNLRLKGGASGQVARITLLCK
jgi:hypothetical protein